MRSMGLDVGTKTIGVALSDQMGWIAQPLEVIRRKDHKEDITSVLMLAVANEVKDIIIGLPKHMSGEEGTQAQQVRHFGEALAKALPDCAFHYIDERLTTVQAEKRLIEMDVRREKRKQIIDAQAAALILQVFLDRKR